MAQRLRHYFLFLCILISSIGSAQNFSEINKKGEEIIGFFRDKKFTEITARVDTLYQSYYTALTLERDWTELTGTYGAFVNSRPIDFEISQYYTFIAYNINFEDLAYVLNLSYNSRGEIIYISFMPAHKVYLAPSYADLSTFSERKLFVNNGMYELPGVLTTPNGKKKSPLVVILVEAGPTDKDGSYEINRPYKDLAWGLASQGISVFRYEKRSNLYSLYLAKDKIAYASFTCREDLLDDLYKALDTLKTLPDIDPENIYVLGHGQGGMLLPLVAKERKDVKGVIMMGANAKRTQEMMIDQYAYLSKVSPEKKAEYDEQARRALFSMNKKLNPLTEHSKMPYEVQATYWIWLNNYPHVEIARKLKKPMLILHGDRDYQVNMENLEIWKKELSGKENVTIKNYSKLNHLFYSGDIESTYSEYYIKSNIPDYVIKDISDWISAH